MITTWFGDDPGPCPVDDAPHTTCVSPDYALTAPVLGAGPVAPTVVAVQRPLVLDQAVIPPVQSTVISEEFTTKTYRRRTAAPPTGRYRVHDKGK